MRAGEEPQGVDEPFAGITSDDARSLKSLLPEGKDFLSLSELEVANLLAFRGKERVSRAATFHQTKGEKRITNLANDLMMKFDGMGERERAEVLRLLRRKDGT